MADEAEGAARQLPLAVVEGRRMPGAWIQWDASSVGEAVAIAQAFKATGKYTCFRGQYDARWRVQSSFARLKPEDRIAEVKKIGAFWEWVTSAPELLPYLQDETSVIAAAQHHGVCRTTFIDFTTDPAVAGWFATEGDSGSEYGAILLAQPRELTPLFDALVNGPTLRFIEIEVANLWRLQAQKGLFLEAQVDLDMVWPLDRIVFPHSGGSSLLERSAIYPERQSHLEQMIAQYHLVTERERKFCELRENTPQILYIEVETPQDITPADLPAYPMPRELSNGPQESWERMVVQTSSPRLSLEKLHGPELQAMVEQRRTAVDFAMVDAGPPLRNGPFQDFLNTLWTGMRPHPFSAAQLTRAISNLARYYPVLGAFPLGHGKTPHLAADQLLEDPLEIEVGIAGGGSARASLSAQGLWMALSPAARTKLGLQELPGSAELLGALDPYNGQTMRLFDYPALADLFAAEMVPWQVAVRRKPCIYWPTHLTALGRP